MKRLTFRGNWGNVHSFACWLGFPYITDGRLDEKTGKVWLTKFTKKERGPGVWCGVDNKNQFIVEVEDGAELSTRVPKGE